MKIAKLKILRIALAVVSLTIATLMFGVYSTDLYAWTYTQFGPALASIFAGFHDGLLLTVALAGITVTGVAILTLIFGRWYCVAICPLGILQDAMIGGLRLVTLRRYKLKPQPNLQRTRYILLIGLLIALAIGWAVPFGLVEPFTQFGSIVSGTVTPAVTSIHNEFTYNRLLVRPEFSAALVKALIPLIILFALVIWKGRIFCTSICPVGTLLGLCSRRSVFRVQINAEKCIGCRKCLPVCPAGCIDLKAKVIDTERCLACMNCIGICPKTAIRYGHVTRALPAPEPMHGRRNFLIGGGLAAVGFGLSAAGLRAFQKRNEQAIEKQPILPPGAGSLARFSMICTGCQLCVQNCEGNVLRPAGFDFGLQSAGQPHLKFNQGMCEFNCQRCQTVCPTGALRKMPLPEKKRWRIGMAKVELSRCVAFVDQNDCGACAEHCPTGALQMIVSNDRDARIPVINEALCIGCGNCEYPCPTAPKSVFVEPISIQVLAADPADVFKAPPPATTPDTNEEWPF